MPLHMKAWEFARKKLNAQFDYEFFFSKKGMKEKDIVQVYNQKFNCHLDESDVETAKHQYFTNNISSAKSIDPVVALVKNYKDILPMSVVSGGTRKNIIKELQIVRIDSHFKIILTADDHLKPKPAPDLFLEAARLMNVEPRYCQVFEDGDLGLEAAVNAGMIATDVRPFLL